MLCPLLPRRRNRHSSGSTHRDLVCPWSIGQLSGGGGDERIGDTPIKGEIWGEEGQVPLDEVARYNLGGVECNSGNDERAIKHWTIAASAGCLSEMMY